MADRLENEVIGDLFTAFNFRVELTVPGMSTSDGSTEQAGTDGGKNQFVCAAAFAECDGLEMTMEPKTIREGGNNARPIHLIGPVSYGQLSLKRGMTDNFDLWDWFDKVMQRGQGGLRASGQVVVLSGDRQEKVSFALDGCLPVKLRAPALNASDGILAIEEMQIVYETLRLQRPGQQGAE
jgi:phage tail-like protein